MTHILATEHRLSRRFQARRPGPCASQAAPRPLHWQAQHTGCVLKSYRKACWTYVRPGYSSGCSRRVTTMAAKVSGYIKLALEAGKANPAPPVGPALGSKGVNIMSFCKEYNAATQDKMGQVIPVEITVFEDRSFTFVLKTPPASFLLKKAAKIAKGAGEPNAKKAGSITQEQLREIAETKLPDLNCTKIESAMRVIAGTARNMGIAIAE